MVTRRHARVKEALREGTGGHGATHTGHHVSRGAIRCEGARSAAIEAHAEHMASSPPAVSVEVRSAVNRGVRHRPVSRDGEPAIHLPLVHARAPKASRESRRVQAVITVVLCAQRPAATRGGHVAIGRAHRRSDGLQLVHATRSIRLLLQYVEAGRGVGGGQKMIQNSTRVLAKQKLMQSKGSEKREFSVFFTRSRDMRQHHWKKIS